jgi:flagellar hook-basal body complex protein FliE
MAVNFNPDVSSIFSNTGINKAASAESAENKVNFGKAIAKSLNKVNDLHSKADASIVDLLTGKNADINSVVASVAKADMSFKLLVGVRDKLVAAYKETMKMQV